MGFLYTFGATVVAHRTQIGEARGRRRVCPVQRKCLAKSALGAGHELCQRPAARFGAGGGAGPEEDVQFGDLPRLVAQTQNAGGQ